MRYSWNPWARMASPDRLHIRGETHLRVQTVGKAASVSVAVTPDGRPSSS
jgi:hypothetical protein